MVFHQLVEVFPENNVEHTDILLGKVSGSYQLDEE